MKRYLPFIIIGVVLLGAVALLAVWLRGKGGAEGQTTTATRDQDSVVVLEEYGDYQCPPCGALYPELKKIEGDYDGRLRIVFHHFPITNLHKNAMAAARAAEAARLQNKFWEMHDRLYRNQKAWADQEDPRPTLISYASELGLDVDRFTRDMDSKDIDQKINTDLQQALARGITGTPTILIDGYQLRSEATNPEGIRRGIDKMLERKASS